MFVNLFILFICINVSMGLVTSVEGSPLRVEMAGDCDYYPESVFDEDPSSPTYGEQIGGAPNIDPVIGNEFGDVQNINDLTGEMIVPTNSTSTDTSYQGDGNPFNALTEPAVRGWKALETMLNVVSGGYIFDIIENASLDCTLDKRALLTTAEECAATPAADPAPCTNPYYGQLVKPKVVTNVQAECDAQYGVGVDTAPCFVNANNAMWDAFKTGIYVIFSMLMMITIFYWLTGRGHILSG